MKFFLEKLESAFFVFVVIVWKISKLTSPSLHSSPFISFPACLPSNRTFFKMPSNLNSMVLSNGRMTPGCGHDLAMKLFVSKSSANPKRKYYKCKFLGLDLLIFRILFSLFLSYFPAKFVSIMLFYLCRKRRIVSCFIRMMSILMYPTSNVT